jgi:hypothetical protein
VIHNIATIDEIENHARIPNVAKLNVQVIFSRFGLRKMPPVSSTIVLDQCSNANARCSKRTDKMRTDEATRTSYQRFHEQLSDAV